MFYVMLMFFYAQDYLTKGFSPAEEHFNMKSTSCKKAVVTNLKQ